MESGVKEDGDGVNFLDRSSRSTRGKRMTKLLDDEIQEDDNFWNQDALMEEENDDNYEEEPEVADVFDSDFDEDEPDPNDEEPIAEEREQREPKKKRLTFPGKTTKKKKKKKKVLSKLEETPKDDDETSQPEKTHDVPDDVEAERTIRKSTRTSVIVRQAERDAIRAALQATMKPIKRKKEGEEKRMSQEEMLLEAAQTEIMNLRNLERVLAREEEVKKRAIVHKAVYSGPQIRYSSRDGCSYLEFTKGVSFQSELSTAPVPCIAIQKQGCHMLQKKLSKFYVNDMQLRTMEYPKRWKWEFYMILFLEVIVEVVICLRRSDQRFQTKAKHPIYDTWLDIEEFQFLRVKVQSSWSCYVVMMLLHVPHFSYNHDIYLGLEVSCK